MCLFSNIYLINSFVTRFPLYAQDDNTKKQALVTFSSFMVFGSVPLIVYVPLQQVKLPTL